MTVHQSKVGAPFLFGHCCHRPRNLHTPYFVTFFVTNSCYKVGSDENHYGETVHQTASSPITANIIHSSNTHNCEQRSSIVALVSPTCSLYNQIQTKPASQTKQQKAKPHICHNAA